MTDRDDQPRNLPAIRTMGVGRWLESFRPRLPGQEYQDGFRQIFTAYVGATEALGDQGDLRACALVEYKLPMILATWWYGKREGSHAGLPLVGDPEDQPSPRRLWRERLAMAKRNWRQSPLTAFTPGRSGARGYLLGDPAHAELREHIKIQHLNPVFLQAIGCLGAPPPPAAADIAVATAFADHFLTTLRAANLAEGALFDKSLRTAFIRRFAVNLAWLRQAKDRLSTWRDGELLLTSVAHRPSRLLAAAWRALGHAVTGFSHGHNYLFCLPMGMVNSGAHQVCDRFVVSSPGEKILVEHARQRHATPFSSTATIECPHHAFFREAFTRLQVLPPVREIRTVMVIGFPMDYHHTPGLVDHHTLTFAHLTLRLMDALRQAGYRVLYKDHPDTLTETAGFFDGRADEILTENFTAVIDRADCLLYVSPFTTTLGYGILSRIPAVIVDHVAWDCWHPEIKASLEKRAAFLPITSDATGILHFQPEDLVTAVRNSQNLTDSEVVEGWAF